VRKTKTICTLENNNNKPTKYGFHKSAFQAIHRGETNYTFCCLWMPRSERNTGFLFFGKMKQGPKPKQISLELLVLLCSSWCLVLSCLGLCLCLDGIYLFLRVLCLCLAVVDFIFVFSFVVLQYLVLSLSCLGVAWLRLS
jgi:hypothetical protein